MKNIESSPLHNNRLFINGEWRSSDQTIPVSNPFSGEVIGHAPYATAAQVKEAIAAAENAFREFRSTPAIERSQLLERLASLIREKREELAQIISLEQGKPLASAHKEIDYGCSYLDWFAGEARRIYGDTIESDRVGLQFIVTKEPIGVVGAITPWNFPFAMVARKLAPALSVGCTVVLKAAEETPFTAYAVASLVEAAGYLPGTVNVVTGDPSEIGKILCADDRVKKVSFTGSTRVGKLIMEQAAPKLKRLSLELGGNAPMIVFESADLDRAVQGAYDLKLRNSSQSCICGNRFLVHRSLYEPFIERLKKRFEKMTVGNGFDQVDMGPLINGGATKRVLGLIESAQKEGAELVCGGQLVACNCIAPTILRGVNQEMRIANEEIFGPVAPVIPFDSEEEAIAIANATPYGLASYFFSRDHSQMMRVNRELQTGMVGVNGVLMSAAQAPFGGVNESGFGREGSKYGIDDYLNIKSSALFF